MSSAIGYRSLTLAARPGLDVIGRLAGAHDAAPRVRGPWALSQPPQKIDHILLLIRFQPAKPFHHAVRFAMRTPMRHDRLY